MEVTQTYLSARKDQNSVHAWEFAHKRFSPYTALLYHFECSPVRRVSIWLGLCSSVSQKTVVGEIRSFGIFEIILTFISSSSTSETREKLYQTCISFPRCRFWKQSERQQYLSFLLLMFFTIWSHDISVPTIYVHMCMFVHFYLYIYIHMYIVL